MDFVNRHGSSLPVIRRAVAQPLIITPAVRDGKRYQAGRIRSKFAGAGIGIRLQVNFAAAGIAGSDSMKTGFTAFRIGIAGFIVPFMFVYGPSLLFIGDWWDIVINTVKAIAGVILLAGFLEGWFFRRLLPVVPRLILGASAIFLIFPRIWSGLVGLGLLLIAYLFVTFVSKSVTSKRA